MQGLSTILARMAFGLALVLFASSCTGREAVTAEAPSSVARAEKVAAATLPPKVYLVNYTASWCPNCSVLEPKLKIARAILEKANAPVEEVRVDYSSEETLKASLPNLASRNLSGLLERWDGITGLVVLAAADNGEPIDCLNRQFSAEAIANFAQAAVERVAETEPGDRFIGGAVCPPSGAGAHGPS